MNEPVSNLWVYLAASPLLWLTITLLAYVAADMLAERLNRHPLANTVLLSAALVALLLLATGTDYATYFDGAQFIHFMLGPATVALAVPLWRNFTLVRRNLGAMAAALLAGSVTAAGSAVAIAWLLGAPTPVLASLAPKSVTAPIAWERICSKKIGPRCLGCWPRAKSSRSLPKRCRLQRSSRPIGCWKTAVSSATSS